MSPRQPNSAAQHWKAGVARVDITPREKAWLAGWATRTEPAGRVTQKVWVKTLALRDAHAQVGVWVTADLLGYSKSMTATLRRRVRQMFKLDPRQLILNASHNHSGPATEHVLPLYYEWSARDIKMVKRYTGWLLDRIIESIGLALADLAPAQISFGQGFAGIAVNRRRARQDGGRCLPAVVDQDVPVLAVRSLKGDLRAVVFGYACHATCVNDNSINGDFPGHAQACIEQDYPKAVALFVAGCGGDANPLPRFRPGLGDAYGRILAAAVGQVLEGKMASLAGPLRMSLGEALLPFEPLPTRKELEALLPGRTGLARREVDYQLSLLRKGDRRPRVCRYPIHVWQLGSGLKLIALSSEPVADYALRFKKAYGWDDVWVSGYNDEFFCYIPSQRIWREGSYEGHTGMMECGLPGPFAPVVEEVVAAKVAELLQATSGIPRPFPKPNAYA